MQNGNKIDVSYLNATIMVARTLIQTKFASTPELLLEVAERARYIHLLANRVKLPLLSCRRLELAAWVSFMDRSDPATIMLITNSHIENILLPEPGQPVAAEQDIFNIVTRYQHVKRAYPQIASDLRRLHKMLSEGISSNEALMLRRFIRILQDEQFIEGNHVFPGRILIVDPEELITPIVSGPLTAEGFDVCLLYTSPSPRDS